MPIDPVTIATITAAVSVLGNEYIKGVAGEAGKTSWNAIKSLFGWKADPQPEEIAPKVSSALVSSPELAEKLVKLLKDHETGMASAMVGKIEVTGGKVVIANTIMTNEFKF
ncbi:MAG: hypothetical protein WAQ52_00945 [Terriglobales bacterium]